MPISIIPVVTSASSPTAKSVTVPESLKLYKLTETFNSGVYTITTSPTSSQANVKFLNSSNNIILDTTTVSGTISVNLASTASSVYVSVNTGTSIVVTINLTASSLSGTTISGTLDTITSSGTYNQTGLMYVQVVGGGGGGGGSSSDGNNYGGSGGGSGGIAADLVYTNSATTITIGSQGNAGTAGGHANAGGTTSFGNIISANGGGGGRTGSYAPLGTAGTPGGATGGKGGDAYGNNPGDGATTSVIAKDITNGTTGGGGGGLHYGTANVGNAGGGSGIGTGGTGGNISNSNVPNVGGAATGYGSGGGGGAVYSGSTRAGGNGRQGVVYVLRGF